MIKMPESTKFIFSKMLVHKKLLLYYSLFCIFFGICNLIEPILAKNVMDKAFYVKSKDELLNPAIIWSVIFVTKYIFQYAQKNVGLKYKLETFKTIRMVVFEDILRKPLQFFKTNTPSYILSRINNDIENLNGIMFHNLISSVLALVQIIIILFFMFKISPLLFLVTIILKMSELILNTIFPLKKLYKNHNEALAEIDSKVQDTFSCIKLVKASSKIDYETKRYQDNLVKYFARRLSRDKINVIREVGSRFILEASYPITIIAGGFFIFYKFMSIGSVVAFILYFQKITPLFNEVAYIVPIFKISQASMERLYEFFSVKNENIINGNRVKSIESIEFKNVTFSYDNKNILSNVSFKLLKNKVNALVGVSGAGKSTIIGMLMGYIKPDCGEILVNGKNFNLYRIQDIRDKISVLSQEPIIFERTMKENIAYNCSSQVEFQSKYDSIVQASYLNTIVDRLDYGVNTILKNNGGNLSGGERQRVCLARELYKDSSVYVFDEATSALDAISENIVMNNIKSMSKNYIVFVVTHRLKNIKTADMIYVLDNGRITENGKHEELINNKMLYYSLYKQQS